MIMPIIKKLIKNLVRKAAMLIKKRPILKRIAMRALGWFPSLSRRLHGLMYGPRSSDNRSRMELVPKNVHNLSPYAQRIYIRIKMLQKKKS
jgi:hypothetical protein